MAGTATQRRPMTPLPAATTKAMAMAAALLGATATQRQSSPMTPSVATTHNRASQPTTPTAVATPRNRATNSTRLLTRTPTRSCSPSKHGMPMPVPMVGPPPPCKLLHPPVRKPPHPLLVQTMAGPLAHNPWHHLRPHPRATAGRQRMGNRLFLRDRCLSVSTFQRAMCNPKKNKKKQKKCV